MAEPGRIPTVRDLMAENPATLDRNETLDIPDTIMSLGRIRHMPVVEAGKVVGILSQRDLFSFGIDRGTRIWPKNNQYADQDHSSQGSDDETCNHD
jgi:acetoin utilization protein AcuB